MAIIRDAFAHVDIGYTQGCLALRFCHECGMVLSLCWSTKWECDVNVCVLVGLFHSRPAPQQRLQHAGRVHDRRRNGGAGDAHVHAGAAVDADDGGAAADRGRRPHAAAAQNRPLQQIPVAARRHRCAAQSARMFFFCSVC